MTSPDYRLVIRALPDAVPVPARLKAVLKRLLRTYRFRCLEVSPITPPSATAVGRVPKEDSMDRVTLIRKLAEEFRRAILACDQDRLPIGLQNFPHGSCGDVSLLFAKRLEQAGLGPTDYVCGWRTDARGERWSHGWLEQDGLIIDITLDQFHDAPAPVLVTADRAWHAARFDVDKSQCHSPADFERYDEDTREMFGDAYALITAECGS